MKKRNRKKPKSFVLPAKDESGEDEFSRAAMSLKFVFGDWDVEALRDVVAGTNGDLEMAVDVLLGKDVEVDAEEGAEITTDKFGIDGPADKDDAMYAHIPEIKTLREMFPSVNATLLHALLEDHMGNVEAVAEELLLQVDAVEVSPFLEGTVHAAPAARNAAAVSAVFDPMPVSRPREFQMVGGFSFSEVVTIVALHEKAPFLSRERVVEIYKECGKKFDPTYERLMELYPDKVQKPALKVVRRTQKKRPSSRSPSPPPETIDSVQEQWDRNWRQANADEAHEMREEFLGEIRALRHNEHMYRGVQKTIMKNAAKLHFAGKGGEASKARNESRDVSERARELREQSRENLRILSVMLVNRTGKIDFHEFIVAEVLDILDHILEARRERQRNVRDSFDVIVGRGIHSTNNQARLHPATRGWLSTHSQYLSFTDNSGTFHVRFKV